MIIQLIGLNIQAAIALGKGMNYSDNCMSQVACRTVNSGKVGCREFFIVLNESTSQGFGNDGC
jgi:hypothetical protein